MQLLSFCVHILPDTLKMKIYDQHLYFVFRKQYSTQYHLKYTIGLKVLFGTDSWFKSLILTLFPCVILAKLLQFSLLQFSQVQKGKKLIASISLDYCGDLVIICEVLRIGLTLRRELSTIIIIIKTRLRNGQFWLQMKWKHLLINILHGLAVTLDILKCIELLRWYWTNKRMRTEIKKWKL